MVLLTLSGEVHDVNGVADDKRLTSEWTFVNGPAPVSFTDASSPVIITASRSVSKKSGAVQINPSGHDSPP